jgi:predicted outer membrane repeat protein
MALWHLKVRLALLCALALAGAPVHRLHAAGGVVGDGTPASCTEQALDSALAAATSISFNCGAAPHTITVTRQKLIGRSTSIDGGGTITLSGGGSTGVLKTASGAQGRASVISLTIRNLTIRDGKTAGQGGAIELGFWNDLTISNSQFVDNQALKDSATCDGGGAIFVGGGSVVQIDASSFSGNRANNGGAINSLRSRLSITGSAFSDNQAVHTDRINGFGDCGGGGAVYIDGTRGGSDGGPDQQVLRGNRYVNNSTNNHGGAIFIGLYSGERVLAEQSSFEGNSVSKAASMGSSGTGGAIWYGAAAGDASSIGLTLRDATLAGNRATSQGGGLWASAPATLTNVTFSANDATDPASYPPDQEWKKGNGGALAVSNSAPVEITGATFANNHAGFNGGAIAGKTITLRNTLFANNSTDWSIKIMQHCTDALTDAGGNMQYPDRNPNPNYFNETNCTKTLTVADPRLQGLADNGGPVRTTALPPGSPAVDAGVSAGCPGADARGVTRPQGARCDIGAYELVQALAVSPALAQQGQALTLTVSGSGFAAGSRVLWSGQPQPTSFVSSTTLRAEIPAGAVSSTGSISVSVSDSSLPAATVLVVSELRRVYLPLCRR